MEESFYQTAQWLDLCARNSIILNPDKFKFGADTVEFAGFEITPTSVRPNERIIKAIMDFPTPKNLTDVRSWFGLVNQVTYAFSMTTFMEPFRSLLRPKIQFQGNEELQAIFDESKRQIVIRLRMVSVYSTKENQRALPPIGRNLTLVTGCSRSIATALKSSPSVATLVGKWYSLVVGSLMLLNHVTLPSKVKPLR